MIGIKWLKTRARKSRESRRGISTIMANLMMLIIVVALSSMLFIWAVSSLSGYENGAGSWFSSRSITNQERLSVESVFFAQGSSNCQGSAYCATVYIRNVGTVPFTISSIYINSTLYQQPAPSSQTCGSSLTYVCVSQVSGIFIGFLSSQTLVHGDLQTVTVATQRGTVVTTTWTY
jgi:hypothetical protein